MNGHHPREWTWDRIPSQLARQLIYGLPGSSDSVVSMLNLWDVLEAIKAGPPAARRRAVKGKADRRHLPMTEQEVRNAAYSARTHEVATRRNNKGRTVQKVTRRGRSTVLGHATDLPLGSALALGRDVRERVHGLSAADILRATERLYGGLIPPLLGTDHAAWSQTIRTGLPTSAERVRATSGALRVRIGRRRRTDERDTATDGPIRVDVEFRDKDGKTTSMRYARSVVACHADHTDPRYRWIGHRKVRRGLTVREARAARAAGLPVDDPANATVVERVVDVLPPDPPEVPIGTSVVVRTRGVSITVRATARTVRATVRTSDWTVTISRRTVAGAWRAALALLA